MISTHFHILYPTSAADATCGSYEFALREEAHNHAIDIVLSILAAKLRGVATGNTSARQPQGVATGNTSASQLQDVASGNTSARQPQGVATGNTSARKLQGVATGNTPAGQPQGDANGITLAIAVVMQPPRIQLRLSAALQRQSRQPARASSHNPRNPSHG